MDFDIVLRLVWRNSDTILGLFWDYPEIIPGLFRDYSRIILGLFWNYSWIFLAFSWRYSGIFRKLSGTIPGRTDPGALPGKGFKGDVFLPLPWQNPISWVTLPFN
jgi:hypothetical protein